MTVPESDIVLMDVTISPFRFLNSTLYEPVSRKLAVPLNEVSPFVLVKITSLMVNPDPASAEFVVDAPVGVETEELAPMAPPMANEEADPGGAEACAETGALP
jgi:hypothetical protein